MKLSFKVMQKKNACEIHRLSAKVKINARKYLILSQEGLTLLRADTFGPESKRNIRLK